VGSAEGAAAVVVGGGMFSVMFVGVGGKCVLSGLEGRWTQSVDWRKRAQGWIVCVTCSGVCGSRATTFEVLSSRPSSITSRFQGYHSARTPRSLQIIIGPRLAYSEWTIAITQAWTCPRTAPNAT